MGYEGGEYAALKAIQSREVTKAVEHLLGICTGFLADNELQDAEIRYLDQWLTQHHDVTTTWPGSVIASRIRDVLADGIITEDERKHLHATLAGIVGFQFPETGCAESGVTDIPFDDDPSIWFDGRSFCFTGNFLYGTRATCERAILDRGSIVRDSISRNLEYLVVGSLIEPSWAHTSYGRKIEKAIDYINKGYGIAIVSERQWTQALTAR